MATYAGLSRRRFLAGALGAGGLGALIACGSQVSTMQNAPYATNTVRNAPVTNATANTVNAPTPAASGSSAVATMDHGNATQSAGSAAAGTATPAKDWKMMNQMHEAGVKTFLAQPKTTRSQPMPFTVQDGIKVFDVTAKKVQWEVTPGEMVEAYTYNGFVPGPEIRVTEGDKVRIRLKNDLGDEATAIHFHGLLIPNAMDGVPFITQPPVNPGEMFVPVPLGRASGRRSRISSIRDTAVIAYPPSEGVGGGASSHEAPASDGPPARSEGRRRCARSRSAGHPYAAVDMFLPVVDGIAVVATAVPEVGWSEAHAGGKPRSHHHRGRAGGCRKKPRVHRA